MAPIGASSVKESRNPSMAQALPRLQLPLARVLLSGHLLRMRSTPARGRGRRLGRRYRGGGLRRRGGARGSRAAEGPDRGAAGGPRAPGGGSGGGGGARGEGAAARDRRA